MPLVAHTSLPTFDRLKAEGLEVLAVGQVSHEGVRQLHVGLLNLMPDAAFKATERQFMRLVGNSKQNIHIYVHPFTVLDSHRDFEIRAYIDQYYQQFKDIKSAGLDALIITGTNPVNPKLEQEPFWQPLREIVDWATNHVTSVLCSCLAVHAIVKHLHDIERQPLKEKRWGVYRHHITHSEHPLLHEIDTNFDVPHSRSNGVSLEQLQGAGFKILAQDETNDVHMAVSPDLFRIIYLQGHPEYDHISLLKEYKREVNRFINGVRSTYPPSPENYFSPEVDGLIKHYQAALMRALETDEPNPVFPEADIEPLLSNTWRDTGVSIFNNWLGLVSKLTHRDRHLPFSSEIDPDDPLKMKVFFQDQ